MTHTIQPFCQAAIEQAGNISKTEAEDKIGEILSIRDSLNKRCEKFSGLEYLLIKKKY